MIHLPARIAQPIGGRTRPVDGRRNATLPVLSHHRTIERNTQPVPITRSVVMLIALLAVLPIAAQATEAPTMQPVVSWNRRTGQAILTTGRLELIVDTNAGLNAHALRDRQTGRVYADGEYVWPEEQHPPLVRQPVVHERSIVFTAWLQHIQVEQSFVLPKDEPGVILERIKILNPTGEAIDTSTFRCGFAKLLDERAGAIRLCPVPYRRETNGEMQEWPLSEVAKRPSGFAAWAEPWQPTAAWGAEGWVWSTEDAALLVAKHNAASMEWSLMEPMTRGGRTLIRFGGAGQWKHGHPEGASKLAAGQAFTFGETRIQLVEGGWKEAYYAYRGWTEAKGCRAPAGYDPPVHWNELYDNEYYFRCCDECGRHITPDKLAIEPAFWPVNEALLKQYYSKELMLAEAAKAKELGCQALYMDPGWDTGANQQLWGEDRLGPCGAWVKRIHGEYGLKVSLWCALGCVPPSYGDPDATPLDARVMNQDGKKAAIPCFASPAFLDTKEKRLGELCRNGVAFLMFDSDQFSGPCYDPTHGHGVPSTREDHARALLELARRLRTRYPKLLIELHDPISGPSGIHYTPTYYGYARPHSFTDLWGHEFMWGPLDDLLSRRAVSLYYYNLAYSIPLYLHVNLKQDNEQSLVFWWFASTCRHLGVGGKPPAPVWEAEKRAMATYRGLKRFYTQGTFHGLDEMVHVHTLPDLRGAVVNAFNLEDSPAKRTVTFTLAEVGLPSGTVHADGAPCTQDGDTVTLDLAIAARGHQLVKLRVE